MTSGHEVVEAFLGAGLELNRTLESMLCEEPAHRTERRGCGFTQATRYLAQRINQPRVGETEEARVLFRACGRRPSLALLNRLVAGLEHEESRLLAGMIRDLMFPLSPDSRGVTPLPAFTGRLAVGSCPLAEKWFLELAHGFIPRKGYCNFIVDEAGRALLLEKIGMGDDHSCLSLRPLLINGVRVPVGSLLAVSYAPALVDGSPRHVDLPGHRLPAAGCIGFRMLRLTTLAVSGPCRLRAFSHHFRSQVASGLFEPETTDIADLQRLARRTLCAPPLIPIKGSGLATG